tara:strand:- start:2411 stop:3142 length:732 start_codon:yes stop_codon:yes gene_type:complete
MSKKKDILTTLEKRHHVLRYSDKNVSDDVLSKILYKAWKVSPSKNNFMPYTVNVLGPGDKRKKIIYDKVVGNHIRYDEKGLEVDTKANPKMKVEYKFEINPSYAHVLENSHLIVFASRVVPEPNEFYKEKVRVEGHYAEQCEVDKVEHIAESTSFEVGLFAQALTVLCLEQGIDVSYCACLPKRPYKWKDTPWLWYDNENQLAKVHSIMSIGYGEYYRYQWLIDHDNKGTDRKPPIQDVVKWR